MKNDEVAFCENFLPCKLLKKIEWVSRVAKLSNNTKVFFSCCA